MIGNGAIAVAPHSARVFEIAYEFLFLGVDADDRLALAGKGLTVAADMAELEISFFTLML